MKREKYLFLNFDDSSKIYPSNKPFDFKVELNEIINLEGNWKVGLVDISYKEVFQELYVYCDICSYSHVFGSQLPILRRIFKPGEFNNIFFIPISRKQISNIHIYVRDKNNNIPSLSVTRLTCTLKLKYG